MRKATLYGLALVCVCLLFALSGPSAQEIVTGAHDPFLGAYVSTSNSEARDTAGPAAQPPDAETLYGVDIATRTLLVVDKATAAVTPVGPAGTQYSGGLAFNPETGLLFAIDYVTGELVTIDPRNGKTVLIGNTGVQLLHGLARDPADGTLYVSNAAYVLSSILYRLDSSTGAATAIGPIGHFDISALALDPTTGILYGAEGGPYDFGELITIDVVTGAGTLVGLTHRITGLAFDATGALYASDTGLDSPRQSSLYAIDKATGAWSLIGTMDAAISIVLDIEFALRDDQVGGVTLCHRPSGSTGSGHTITVGPAAVPAHLAHGDESGPCPRLISAALSVESVTADPAVFFKENASDVPGDDSVLVDVMLRMGTAQGIDGYSLEVHFDPAMVQVTQVEGSVTPFGACNAINPTCLMPSPICFDNLANGNANATGTLLAGVAVLGACPTYNASGEVTLFTLGFTATSIGQSRIVLISGPSSGDCEIYNDALDLGIPCLDGNATISASQ